MSHQPLPTAEAKFEYSCGVCTGGLQIGGFGKLELDHERIWKRIHQHYPKENIEEELCATKTRFAWVGED
eukprot:5745280-Amphidinium_carterae.1